MYSQPARQVFDFPQGHNVSSARENTRKKSNRVVSEALSWQPPCVYVCVYTHIKQGKTDNPYYFTEKGNQTIGTSSLPLLQESTKSH